MLENEQEGQIVALLMFVSGAALLAFSMTVIFRHP